MMETLPAEGGEPVFTRGMTMKRAYFMIFLWVGIVIGVMGCATQQNAMHPADEAAAYTDSDEDGVVDKSDMCPNTLKIIRVDHRGCPSSYWVPRR